jgi:hypothetical protein
MIRNIIVPHKLKYFILTSRGCEQTLIFCDASMKEKPRTTILNTPRDSSYLNVTDVGYVHR